MALKSGISLDYAVYIPAPANEIIQHPGPILRESSIGAGAACTKELVQQELTV